jgi:hypothetical protein
VKAASITRLLPISVSAPDDCLTPVANIISIE